MQPEEYGKIHFFLGISGLIQVISMIGSFNSIVVLSSKEKKSHTSLFLLSLVPSIILSIIAYIIFSRRDVGLLAISYVIFESVNEVVLGNKFYQKYTKIILIQKVSIVVIGIRIYQSNYFILIIKMAPLKFGIIGCSRIAKRSVIPAILKSEFAELGIIGSRDTKKAKEFANEFDCQKFGNYDDVISNNEIDAVYISTPIGKHEEWVNKAASAGKHVYCEKSSTDSFTSAKEMVECSKNNNVRIMEGFMFRFHPQHQKVKELINNKKIGNVDLFNGSFGFPSFPDGDIRYNKELGGGFLNDTGCYPIYASRMIFGEEPVSVFCHSYNDSKMDVDIKGTSILTYKNNKTANVTYANGSYYQAKYEVWGSQGIISLDRAYSVPPDFITKINLQYSMENNWDSRKNEIIKIPATDHFVKMIDAFCMEITGKEKSSFNFEKELLNQAKVMEAHRLSNLIHKEKYLDDID
jgi:predicted dehydrogenase